MSQSKKSQIRKQSQSAEDAPKANNKPYCGWVWNESLQGYVSGPLSLYDGTHSIKQAIAHYQQLYGVDRLFRIDKGDVIQYINKHSEPQQLSLFDI